MKKYALIIVVLISLVFFGVYELDAEEINKFPLKTGQFYHVLRSSAEEGILIHDIQNEPQNASFEISITSEIDSTLTLWIPIDLTETRYKCKKGGYAEQPFILIDGEEVQNKSEKKIIENSMFFEIPVLKGSKKIEVIFAIDSGMWEFPEGCPISFFDQAIPYQPLKQIKKGILPQDVICREGLELYFKSTDKSPACVTFETGVKLPQRGWGLHSEHKGVFMPELGELHIGDVEEFYGNLDP